MAKIAVLLADEFEDSEYTQPVGELKKAGHEVEVLGVEKGKKLKGKQGDAEVKTDAAVTSRKAQDYAALLIPGGHSPDALRIDEGMVQFVRDFADTGRPIAAICHGPQLLIEAEVVRGRTMTSWPSVRTDLKNAGATVVDKEVCEDAQFITSRKPADLKAFSAALLEKL